MFNIFEETANCESLGPPGQMPTAAQTFKEQPEKIKTLQITFTVKVGDKTLSTTLKIQAGRDKLPQATRAAHRLHVCGRQSTDNEASDRSKKR